MSGIDDIAPLIVYDGTLEGLLCAVMVGYRDREPDAEIVCGTTTPRIGQRIETVTTRMEDAERVRRGLIRAGGPALFSAVAQAAMACTPDTGTVVYRFIRHAIESGDGSCRGCRKRNTCTKPCLAPSGNGVLSDIAHPDVAPFYALRRRVSNESERMRQFIRFNEGADGVWFARCNPSCNVVPLVMGWFCARFNIQPFVIYDEEHAIAGVHEQRGWYLVSTDDITLPAATADEVRMRDAWRTFYRSVSIDARYNPELRRNFMPMRLWRNLTELQEDIEPGLKRV